MIEPTDILSRKIALSLSKCMHGTIVRELLDRIGEVEAYFSLSRAELRNLTGINSDVFDMAYRQGLLERAEREAALIREKNIDCRFISDSNYPRRLAFCDDAPAMLYSFGNFNLDAKHVIGVVGTRHATPYGTDFTARLVSDLAQKIDDLVVVSGLAYGIDVAAHKAALSAGVTTVGVMAHGLSRIYPSEHRQIAVKMAKSGSGIITEYTYETSPQKGNFLARNRIIAGLSDCVVVVESDIKGGAMSTARTAISYNRDVFSVPGRINDTYSRGTNMLIANNMAQLITCADDVIASMNWETKSDTSKSQPSLFRALSAEEQEIIDYITQSPESTINEICVNLNKSFASVTDILLQLEMDDIIITLPGGRYAPTTKANL